MLKKILKIIFYNKMIPKNISELWKKKKFTYKFFFINKC